MNMISLDQVTKLYGVVIGVNDLTADLPVGSYGLLGPNGSGKTTLLNLITGQLRATAGVIRVFGEASWNNADLYRRMGYCPAREPLLLGVSAHRWVSYLLELQGYARKAALEKAESALVDVGLANDLHRPMHAYSKGMKQRAKLAQAMAHEPDLLILDEPFNGLDPLARIEMSRVLRGWSEAGRSLLLASHILHEVESITPRFLLIRSGRLLASGSAREIQGLLLDAPNQIHIDCDNPVRLAQLVAQADAADAWSIDRQRGRLTLTTRSAQTLYRELPGWLENEGVQVTSLHSNLESLQSLFDSLMRIHRGEAT